MSQVQVFTILNLASDPKSELIIVSEKIMTPSFSISTDLSGYQDLETTKRPTIQLVRRNSIQGWLIPPPTPFQKLRTASGQQDLIVHHQLDTPPKLNTNSSIQAAPSSEQTRKHSLTRCGSLKGMLTFLLQANISRSLSSLGSRLLHAHDL